MNTRRALKLALMAGLVVTQTAFVGASVWRPVSMSPGDRCHRCERLISDRFVGAEIIGESGANKFRTIRCMLAYLHETGGPVKQVFAADDQTGTLVDVERAIFVPVSIDVFTGEEGYGIGETDYIAFKSTRAAERFAADHGAKTMSWPAVVYYAAFLPARAEAR
jgi:nitrous oxide reductase accessory protein NosL